MKKKIFILLLATASAMLISCSKADNGQKEADTTKDSVSNQTQASDTNPSKDQNNTETSTKENEMNNEILKDNKLNADLEKIQSISVRSGNTGETVLTVSDKDKVSEIAGDILSVKFTKHDESQSDGLRYELIIKSDKEFHLAINSNSDLYIFSDSVNQKINCETDFDLVEYIENTLLNTTE